MTTDREMDDLPEPGQRGVPTYGCVIKQQRLAMNLSQEELAAKAVCDVRVIMKAEKDGPISLKKLHKIAEALAVPFGFIANIDGEDKSSGKDAYCEVTVSFKLHAGPLLDKKGLDDFTSALKSALAPFEHLFATRVREGSVLIDFKMSIETLNALCIAQEYGALPEFAIEWIRVSQLKPPIITEFDIILLKLPTREAPTTGRSFRDDILGSAIKRGDDLKRYVHKAGQSFASPRFEQAPTRVRALGMVPTRMLEE